MKKQIKLMPDYHCYPLWWMESVATGDISPATLPLSAETISRLELWVDAYDALLNPDDPYTSDFPSEREKEAFEQEGIRLWKQLRAELAPEYEVFYYSIKRYKLLTQPDELTESFRDDGKAEIGFDSSDKVRTGNGLYQQR